MNQEKIGKFILELRKEKNMTQQELADKIGVTDRAISKWENGRGMPDLSLMRPLCEELGISINELISGERLNKKEYQEKSEENIINTINYTNKKINRTKNTFIVVILIILVIIVMFITMFCIDINRMKNNKPVIFSTWGYSYTPPIDLKEEEIELAIINFILEKGDNETKNHDNEKTFASMKTYLIEEKEKDTHYDIYAWVLEGKYYLENDEIKQDSGSSIPYKFVVKSVNDKFVVSDFKIPRDGSYYSVDMKNIFPSSVRKNMDDVYTDGTIERLKLDIERQTKLYFHK